MRRFWRNPLSLLGLAIVLAWTGIALLAPALAPHDPVEVRMDARMQPPGPGRWLGTDFYGRDILSRILYGARYDLLIALFAVGVAAGVGAPLGILAGCYGGHLDDALMRLVDTARRRGDAIHGVRRPQALHLGAGGASGWHAGAGVEDPQ